MTCYNNNAIRPVWGKQAGMSEIGALIVLMVAVAVGVGAFKVWPNISYSMKKSALTSDISLIAAGAESYKAGRSTFANATITEMCAKMNIQNSNICNNPTTANPFGGSYVSGPAADPSKFSLKIDTKKAEIAASVKSDFDSADGWTASINGTTVELVK